MDLLTAQTVKKFEFPKSKMADGGHLKSVKSTYLSNRLTDFDEIKHGRLTDFDEIKHGDANWPPAGDRPLKFRIFQKPRCRRPPS